MRHQKMAASKAIWQRNMAMAAKSMAKRRLGTINIETSSWHQWRVSVYRISINHQHLAIWQIRIQLARNVAGNFCVVQLSNNGVISAGSVSNNGEMANNAWRGVSKWK
jgi:hypothetical protein